jgi:hypothetical protein
MEERLSPESARERLQHIRPEKPLHKKRNLCKNQACQKRKDKKMASKIKKSGELWLKVGKFSYLCTEVSRQTNERCDF